LGNLWYLVSITEQSSDIAVGVNETETHEQGAGDQRMVFGYAPNETKEPDASTNNAGTQFGEKTF
jgi:S-adenosylmethionine synthetase